MLTSDWLSQGLVTRPGTTIDLRYDYVPQTQLRSGRRALDRDTIALPTDREIERYTRNHYATLTLDHQFTGAWGINLQVPFISRPHSTFDEGETVPSFSRTRGLGDIRLTGRWQASGESGINGLQFGLKLPTGRFRQKFLRGPTTGEEVDRGLQPGTGTLDAILGAYRLGALATNWEYIVQGQAQIPLGDRDGYRPGVSATASAGLHYTGWKGLTPQLQLIAKALAKDHGANSDRDNSGGELVYVAPGFIAALAPRASATAYVQLPVYQRVGGYQVAPRYILSLGVQYRL